MLVVLESRFFKCDFGLEWVGIPEFICFPLKVASVFFGLMYV